MDAKLGGREPSLLPKYPLSLLAKSDWVPFLEELFSPLPFLLPPCAAPFSQVSLGRILLAREMNPFFRAGFTLCGSLAGPLTPHLFDYFFAVAWGGLATCWRRTSERILSVCCAARFHLVSRGFTKSWVGQVVSLDAHGH